jgi:hypothetical protein
MIAPGTATEEVEAPADAAVSALSAPAPATVSNFDGLDFANWGAGHPPDTNGDVGPTYYVQTINTSIGIYDKSDGTRVTAFVFDDLMKQGNFGNVCDTENFGDPVVLYDTFEDRWVITDFAFKLLAGAVVPPALQCFAVSKTGDPVSGGWNFYSIETLGGLGDYPKLGVWPDGIYMSANMFNYAAGGSFQNPRVWAFNKAQMYAGASMVQVVSFDAPAADFTLLPSNARLQAGTPPAGTPNYFVSTWEFLNALTVYKFHVDWDRISLSTFTGPEIPIAATSWPSASVPNAPSLGGNSLDVLQIRAMMQSQYSNIAGVESLWATHTVRRANATGFAAPRWYQLNVTGGTVAPTIPQAATWDPDAANVIHRFMPSLAVDRNGDMALGYSTSSSTTKPAVKYAGRLASDPLNTFSQTEQLLIQGAGTQTGNCGGAACARWGDYSAMSLDPDGCAFWYTNMYYAADGLDHHTRIGAFSFPGCTPVGDGTLSGTVTDSVSHGPIAGASVALGSRTTTTDLSGAYSFTVPAGTYPSVTASAAGFGSSTSTGIVINDGAGTTRNFVLSAAPASACFTDTTQGEFQTGVATNCDLTTSPGDVILLNAAPIDQQNLTVTNSGFGVNATAWAGQTFRAGASGQLTRVDLDLFCSGCTGTTPNLTVAIRATTGSPALPTGPDLATATIPGFSSGAGGFFTANFATPAAVTAGTTYAVVFRAAANPSLGTYAYVCSCAGTGTVNSNPYLNGLRVTSGNSGGTWTADATVGGRDLGFKVFVQTGFPSSGTFVSSTKDANPVAGAIVTWGDLSWTATTPAGTDVKLQAAASNNPAGPFTFVGPDGTAASFFASGGTLAQFTGLRYLKYRAVLSSTNPAVTPTLSSVTTCFDDVPSVTALAVASASGVFGGTADLSATLTAGGAGVSGKPVTFTLNGTPAGSGTTDSSGVARVLGASLAGIGAGTYPNGVAASFAGDGGYTARSGSNSLTVDKAPASVTLDPASLSAVYDGSPHAATATTVPPGLGLTFTYDGSPAAPTGAGSYAVVATVDDANYAGSATGTLTILTATATVTLSGLNPTYDGTPKSVSVTTIPPGLGVQVTYNGSPAAPTNVGSYSVLADVVDANYAGSASGTLTIGAATATISLGDLGPTYDGTPKSVSVTTNPPGLAVNVTYDGSSTPPTNAGSYAVAAHIVDANYVGSATATLTIAKATAAVSFGGLTPVYDGTPKSVSVTTNPPGLVVLVTYDGGPTPPTNAGSYAVTATVVDANYVGFAMATLTIGKATASVSVVSATVPYDGTPKTVSVSTVPAGLTVSVTYNGSPTPPTAPGSYAVVATVQDANYAGSGSGTLTIGTTLVVRHAPILNGTIDGSVEMLLPENVTLNGGSSVSSDLLVPGTPTVRLNGHPTYGGTLDGGGSASPSSYVVTLNGRASLRHVVRRTDAVPLPALTPPPPPTGSRTVILFTPHQSPGDFATLRNLALIGNTGVIAVPPGNYGTFIANSGGGFVLGVAGATVPAVYNMEALVLTGHAELQIAGPVILKVGTGVILSGTVGAAAHPEWLMLQIPSLGLAVNGNATVSGFVVAPVGTVILDGTLTGGVASDRFILNGGGSLSAGH